MSFLVYVGDTSFELAEQIAEKLKQYDAPAKIFNTLAELADNSERTLPDMVVLGASILNDSDAAADLFSKVPVLIFAPEMDIDDQTAWYNRGVKRVIVERTDLPARVASHVKMILIRRSKLRQTRQSSLTHGTVQAFSLQEVLQNALLEKKDLIFKIRQKEWDAKIRTFQGHVVSAFTSNLQGADAVLKTLQLSSGSFIIRGYQKLEETSHLSASTLALLAEAKFERKEIQKFLHGMGKGIKNPRFQLTMAEPKANLSPQKSNILDVVRKHDTFYDIVLNSPFPVIKTVRMLSDLTVAGLISPEGEGEAIETFQPHDIEYIRKELMQEGQKAGNLVILGMPSTGRSELVRTLAGIQKASIKSVQSLDFTRINLRSDLTLTVFGISMDDTLLPVMEKLSQGMIACIFLVDYSQKDQFEFLNYLLSRIVQIYSVPLVIGLTHVDDQVQALKDVRKYFNIPEGIAVLPVQPGIFGDIRKLLHGLNKALVELEEGEKNA